MKTNILNENESFVWQLPTAQKFEYNGTLYRTIAPIKKTVVNSCHLQMRREVMDLITYKTITLTYFTKVTVISEKTEKTEN